MKIYVRNSWCKVDLEGLPVPEELVKALSYVDKQQSFASFRYTGVYEPSVKSLYNKRSNSFPTGNLFSVEDHLKRTNVRFSVIDLREVPPTDWQPIPDKIKNYGSGHQAVALTAMRDNLRGTIEGITAMGKTYIEGGFASIFPGSLLILSHRKEIFSNIVLSCEELTGEEIGIINASAIRPKRVTVAMVGTLYSRLAKLQSYLKTVDAVLVDESHHISMGSQYFKVVQACENACYRFGLTATPWRDSGDSLAVFSATGPIIYSYAYAEAVQEGVVVPLEVFLIPIDARIQLPILYDFKDIYSLGIVKCAERNEAIARIATHLVSKGENVLILVWQIAHGRKISNLLDPGIHEFIHGTSAGRLDSKSAFESGDLPILVASSIYDEGVNIERIQNIIIAAGYKSERLLVQRTGRGMRVFEGKEKCRIFDFMDLSHAVLEKHSKARLKYYKRMKFAIKHLQV
jgi:superfamily II DNA or RNA helicase